MPHRLAPASAIISHMPQQLRLVSALLLAFVVAVATDDSGCYETWHKTWLTIRAMNPDITTYDPETTTFRATHSGPTTYEIPIFFREGSNRAELTALAKHVYTLYPHAITDAVDYMMELLETSANKIPDKLPCDDGVPDGASLVRPASAPVLQNFFVEIGTSDFGTLHQQLFKDPAWGGLAVEPMEDLLSRLPTRGGLYKENAAMGCPAASGATATMRRVDPAKLQYRAEHHELGTATLVDPNGHNDNEEGEQQQQQQQQFPVEYLSVRCMTWNAIAARHGLTTLDGAYLAREFDSAGTADRRRLVLDKFPGQQRIFVIKVDAEGSDAVILHEIIDWYEEAEQAIVEATTGKKKGENSEGAHDAALWLDAERRTLGGVAWPLQIRFENWLEESTDKEHDYDASYGLELVRAKSRLCYHGYNCSRFYSAQGRTDEEDESWGLLSDTECRRESLLPLPCGG